MKFLVHTGASNNYIRPNKQLTDVVPVDKPFTFNSIHGSDSVTKKFLLTIFGHTTPFFLLDILSSFDGIIGLDLLTQVKAIPCLKAEQIMFRTGFEPSSLVYQCKFSKIDAPDA